MKKQTTTLVVAAITIVGGVAIVGNYLSTPSGTALRADPNNVHQVATGKVIYEQSCASCHGAGLEGERNWRRTKPDGSLRAPPHDETGHTWHHPDDLLFQITKEGGRPYNPRSAMPGFGGTLTDDEIWSVLAYIKSRWPEPIRERQRDLTLANRGQ
jgi:mono/diheme cytochrome c family protein